MPLTVEYIKQKFCTYTESKKKHVLYDELGLSDDDLKKFLERFDLQLYADTYESQIENCSSSNYILSVMGLLEIQK